MKESPQLSMAKNRSKAMLNSDLDDVAFDANDDDFDVKGHGGGAIQTTHSKENADLDKQYGS